MKIIIGLGNYDEKYKNTYHNMGFDVVDALADKLGVTFKLKKTYKSLVGETTIAGLKYILAKTLSFMNNSGDAVKVFRQKYKDARILVVTDDIDLPRGSIRYKEHGSGGTHNGLRSIVNNIGPEFERLKIGIGRDIFMDLKDYVLSKYDKETFKHIIEKAVIEILDRLKWHF